MCRRAMVRLVPRPGAGLPFHWSPPDQLGIDQHLFAAQLRISGQVAKPGDGDVASGRTFDAVISTGEPLSIFPRAVWRGDADFEPHIEWLSPDHRYAPNARPGRVPNYPGPDRWIFRDRHPFRLGQVRVQVYDNVTPRNHPTVGILHPATVIARFLLEDSPDVREPIFGVQASILSNRRLVREPVWDATRNHPRQMWWLEEVT
jgi:hypothetical protein